MEEDQSRLAIIEARDCADGAALADLLRGDSVILVKDIRPERADAVLHDVCERLGLLEKLQFQAEFAPAAERERIGKYRMTVTKRGDYQVIPPHSEGNSLINIQLASFYCVENSTDGGESLFMNVDDDSDAWDSLREIVVRIAPGSRPLTSAELQQARALYRLHSSPHLLPGDQILRERDTSIRGLKIVDVLTKAAKSYSSILDLDLHAYWSSISIIDTDSLRSYVSLLKQLELLREPEGGLTLAQLDRVAKHRCWASQTDYNRLFSCRITRKLNPGELVILNNLTWAHAATNWTPGHGVRNIVAAFA